MLKNQKDVFVLRCFTLCIHSTVVSTLRNFVKMFVRAREENYKQLEFEKRKAEREEKMRS